MQQQQQHMPTTPMESIQLCRESTVIVITGFVSNWIVLYLYWINRTDRPLPAATNPIPNYKERGLEFGRDCIEDVNFGHARFVGRICTEVCLKSDRCKAWYEVQGKSAGVHLFIVHYPPWSWEKIRNSFYFLNQRESLLSRLRVSPEKLKFKVIKKSQLSTGKNIHGHCRAGSLKNSPIMECKYFDLFQALSLPLPPHLSNTSRLDCSGYGKMIIFSSNLLFQHIENNTCRSFFRTFLNWTAYVVNIL